MTPEQRIIELEQGQSDILQQLRDTKHNLANTAQQLNTVLRQNEALRNQLNDVLTALKGNDLTREKGIIDRLIALEEFMQWIKRKKTVLTGWFLGVSFIFGIISAVFWGTIKFIAFLKSMQ